MQRLLLDYTAWAENWPETEVPPMVFADYLFTRRDTWFVEVGDAGVLYLTNIVPEEIALFHVAFWDKKFPASRVAAAQMFLKTAFSRFALTRIGTLFSVQNGALPKKLVQIGFKHEGTLRLGWRGQGDAHIFGLLPEDLPWTVKEMPPSSLD